MAEYKRLTRLEKDNVYRMLQGCINRICISDDPAEIFRLVSGANRYLDQLAADSLIRISEDAKNSPAPAVENTNKEELP